jgi:hypothetical protein
MFSINIKPKTLQLHVRLGALTTMSSSDTSSEEDFDLLREAADRQFINDSMFSSNRTGDMCKGKLTFVSRQI